ncbi:MAG: VCBS domain-containing protein [Beijerinckiaceae bacterium]|nr:VCBS domain-containing protein [Beijerinckiaceae bacterium]
MAGTTVSTQAGVAGRVFGLRQPNAGTAEVIRLAPGDALNLSAIANDPITILKVDGRLVILFQDKAHIIVEGLFLPNGQPAQDIAVNLDGNSTVMAGEFVAQAPITSDLQILTAAGVSLPPRGPLGGGGPFGNGTGFESLPGQALNDLNPQEEFRRASFEELPDVTPFLAQQQNGGPGPAAQAPVAVANQAAVSEAGVQAPGNTEFPGQPNASGNVLLNDTTSGVANVTGAGVGASESAGNVGATLVGTYGQIVINADGTYTYVLDNGLPQVQALSQGLQVTDIFTYRVTDSSGLSSTATVTVTITGTNDQPVIDIDTGAAGTGYQGFTAEEAARSTDTVIAANGVTIVRQGQVSVADPDGDTFSRVDVTLSATGTGEAGMLVHGATTGPTLSFIAGPGGFSAAEVQALVSEIRYVNTERTFALDIADRVISVTVTDAFGATATVLASIPVIADVRDTTGLNDFTGTRFDDRIEGMGGADTIRAGDGNDTIIYRAGDGADLLLDGGAGTDTLSILGNDSDNIFRVTFSGTALDRLSSESDPLTAGPNLVSIEAVSLLAGLGQDTLDYSGTGVPVSADLLAGTASGFTSIGGVENLTGGSESDTLAGDNGANIIIGGDGNDLIDGRGGDNTLDGGAGADTINAGDGDNSVDAGEGDNSVTLGHGNNAIVAGAGADIIVAGNGDNSVNAGDGDNIVDLGGGANSITSGTGRDTIVVGNGDNGVDSGAGDDQITLGNGANTVAAGEGDNTILAGDGDNGITAGTGLDRITVGNGSNTIDAGDGDNIVLAGNGGNAITAGSGANSITSGSGADTVTAGDGDNSVDAGGGDNVVTLGGGANAITTGSGADTINAGDGDNSVLAGDGDNVITLGGGANSITSGTGRDTIVVGDGDNGVDSGAGDDQITLGNGANTVAAGEGDNTILAGDGDNGITAGTGLDRITVGNGSNTIDAGDGDNIVVAGNGGNAITAGSGANSITSGSGADTVTAGDGDNSVDAGGGDNVVTLGGGANAITTGSGADTINAGDGDNSVLAGDGDNVITLGNGSNVIVAGSGDDTIVAGNGGNDISAGGGVNQITSGSGDDTITLSGTSDTVNAGNGSDQITVTGVGNATIDAGGGDDTILAGIGNDVIFGGLGADDITTGLGADIVAYRQVTSEGGDTLRDFMTGVDAFQFLASDIGAGLAFGGADTGTLDASRFFSGANYTNSDQRFLFNTGDQTLYYDADGSGGGASMIALATLEAGTVTASDIKIV